MGPAGFSRQPGEMGKRQRQIPLNVFLEDAVDMLQAKAYQQQQDLEVLPETKPLVRAQVFLRSSTRNASDTKLLRVLPEREARHSRHTILQAEVVPQGSDQGFTNKLIKQHKGLSWLGMVVFGGTLPKVLKATGALTRSRRNPHGPAFTRQLRFNHQGFALLQVCDQTFCRSRELLSALRIAACVAGSSGVLRFGWFSGQEQGSAEQ